MLERANEQDICKRVMIIDALVELLVVDEVDQDDIEDCLDDYMELGFNVVVQPEDHVEIA